jgi:hypothetical protein
MSLPVTLPERPIGWTKRMTCHLNFGGGKGSGSFEVRNDAGELTPIVYLYRQSKKETVRGFTLPDVDDVMTWTELRAAWPAYLERTAAAAKDGATK